MIQSLKLQDASVAVSLTRDNLKLQDASVTRDNHKTIKWNQNVPADSNPGLQRKPCRWAGQY